MLDCERRIARVLLISAAMLAPLAAEAQQPTDERQLLLLRSGGSNEVGHRFLLVGARQAIAQVLGDSRLIWRDDTLEVEAPAALVLRNGSWSVKVVVPSDSGASVAVESVRASWRVDLNADSLRLRREEFDGSVSFEMLTPGSTARITRDHD